MEQRYEKSLNVANNWMNFLCEGYEKRPPFEQGGLNGEWLINPCYALMAQATLDWGLSYLVEVFLVQHEYLRLLFELGEVALHLSQGHAFLECQVGEAVAVARHLCTVHQKLDIDGGIPLTEERAQLLLGLLGKEMFVAAHEGGWESVDEVATPVLLLVVLRVVERQTSLKSLEWVGHGELAHPASDGLSDGVVDVVDGIGTEAGAIGGIKAGGSNGQAVVAGRDEFFDGYVGGLHIEGALENEAQVGFDESVASSGVAGEDATPQLLFFLQGVNMISAAARFSATGAFAVSFL